MDKILNEAKGFLKNSRADAVAIASIDFTNQSFQAFEVLDGEIKEKDFKIFFDLASLTKPLTNSVIGLTQKLTPELELLLNHRAGLPAWGLLDRKSWKEDLKNYPIKAADTVYSDYSALRFMLEAQDIFKIDYKEYLSQYWDKEICFWKDLNPNQHVLQNGFYGGRPNLGKVHDPNAYNLNCFCSHAGLFGTISGLCTTLLGLDKSLNLLKVMSSAAGSNRFKGGFDTVSEKDSLAGNGCSRLTFGHLGFTGTSFWIDPECNKGWVLLANATKYYWFDKKELNNLRRTTGTIIWQNS